MKDSSRACIIGGMIEKENIYEIAYRRKVERDQALEQIQEIKEAIQRYIDGMGIGELASFMEGFEYRIQ